MTRLLILGGAVALVLLSRIPLSRPGTVPGGQPALVEIRDVGTLKAEFNRTSASMRVFLVLSASCPYCLKGATSAAQVLEQYRDRPLAVFVVWLPILPTDWGQPWRGALHRLPDPRVRQFWDPDRVVARAMQDSYAASDLAPGCCDHKGVWFDFLAVYAPGTEWRDRLPAPLLLDGTVEDATPGLEGIIATAIADRR